MNNEACTLFTGGSGLLGNEMRKIQPDWLYPLREELDVSDYSSLKKYIIGKNIDTIVHAAAFTSPPRIDNDPVEGIKTNIIGTANIVNLSYHLGARLIYISTDYVFDGKKGNYLEEDPVYPVNKYAWSKLGGECAVRLYDKSLVIRLSFSANKFPYPRAFCDQWTSKISVSEAAKRISLLVDTDLKGTIHIGDTRKSVLEFAKSISPNAEIGSLKISEVSFEVPRDTSLNTNKYDEFIKTRNQ